MPAYRVIYESLQAQLARVGIKMEVNVVDHATMHDQIRKDVNPLVVYVAFRPTADAYLTQFFHSDAIVVTGKNPNTNFAHYDKVDQQIDTARAALGENASRQAVEVLRARLGLDAPLPVQYARFVGDLLRGDLGVSMINGTSVRDQVGYNLPFTLQLSLARRSSLASLGVPVGVYTAVQRNRAPDYIGRILSLAGLSTPAFFLGILLILLFGVQLKWLPAIGGGNPDRPLDVVASPVLPALTLGLVMTASVARISRSARR